MREIARSPEAISRLTPEQNRGTQQGGQLGIYAA